MTPNNPQQAPRLLGEFPVPDLQQWRDEVDRLLKGAPFAKKMFTRTLEGLEIGPMYTAADVGALPWAEHLPGQPPYVRGHWPRSSFTGRWLVAQELAYPTVEEFNQALREDLERGLDIACLRLDSAGFLGLDPDQADPHLVGQDGTSLASLAELETALQGVDLARIPLCMQPGSSALPMAAMLVAMLRRQDVDLKELKGGLGSDPVFGLARSGSLPTAMDQIQDELAILTRWAVDNAPQVTTLPIYEKPWHNGGADSALGLGLCLAAGVNTLRAMEQRGLEPDLVHPRLRFRMIMGPDFFMEIAKLRALRLLWSDIASACGCSPECSRVLVHARTSIRSYSALDPHVNMLRAVTMAMSAVLGGADSLHVDPFDAVDSLPDQFSRRIARNVQLILAEECHFDQVADPAGGSWYVEKLTADLAARAWEIFREIEAAGGVVAALKSGLVQAKVAAAAELRRERLATGKDVLVGTTRFANPQESERQARTVDHQALHAERAAAMSRHRTAAAHEDHLIVLKRLEKVMTAGREELFEALVEAAGHGATVGELTGTLRHAADPQLQVEPIPTRRDARPFEDLRRRVKDTSRHDPRRGRVFCANLGDFAGYMPRLDFVKGFFQTGGFQVLADHHFATAEDAVAAASQADAATVVLVGLDASYAELGAEVVSRLDALRPRPGIVLAGAPGDLEDQLRQAGLDTSINARSNLLDTLGDILDSTEVQP